MPPSKPNLLKGSSFSCQVCRNLSIASLNTWQFVFWGGMGLRFFLLLFLMLIFAGCSPSTGAQLSGWLTEDSDMIAQSRPAVQPKKGEARVLRDEGTNGLRVYISPKPTSALTNSTVPASREVIVEFEAASSLGVSVERVVLPITHSNHISMINSRLSPSGTRLFVHLSMDEVGLDLFLASLLSPTGLRGVIEASGSISVTPLVAQSYSSGILVGSVWTRRDHAGRPEIIFHNHVEFPYYVETIYLKCEENIIEVEGKSLTSYPGRQSNLRLSSEICDGALSVVAVKKRIVAQIPNIAIIDEWESKLISGRKKR